MKRVVVDASALAAMVFQEAKGKDIRDSLTGAIVFAPNLLKFELTNVAWKKVRQQPARGPDILVALSAALDRRSNISWQDVQPTDVVLVAHATGLSVYDASYLWLAGSLGADLVTLDAQLAAASEHLNG
jgi:predicted nucleic acid-binding protein